MSDNIKNAKGTKNYTPVCTYCGKRFASFVGASINDVPKETDEVVKLHVATCAKNPSVIRLLALQKALTELQEYNTLLELCLGFDGEAYPLSRCLEVAVAAIEHLHYDSDCNRCTVETENASVCYIKEYLRRIKNAQKIWAGKVKNGDANLVSR